MNELVHFLGDTWHVWFVTVTLIVAAVIDGLQLKVPNWITYPMILSGWAYSAVLSSYAGWEGLGYSLLGTVVGLALADATVCHWRNGCWRREIAGRCGGLDVANGHVLRLCGLCHRGWSHCCRDGAVDQVVEQAS